MMHAGVGPWPALIGRPPWEDRLDVAHRGQERCIQGILQLTGVTKVGRVLAASCLRKCEGFVRMPRTG
jgi:hypothetical protein